MVKLSFRKEWHWKSLCWDRNNWIFKSCIWISLLHFHPTIQSPLTIFTPLLPFLTPTPLPFHIPDALPFTSFFTHLDSISEQHLILVFLSLGHFINSDDLQFQPFSCKQHNFILFYDLIKLYCVYIPHFLYLFTHWWTPRRISYSGYCG